jgi:MoaA/NifB/PqqE/SkfB family radical SAM enzyme
MSTEEWQTVLLKAWNAGIPHAVFTGGEATLRADLPTLTTYAEKLGMVTGLLSDGSRLCDTAYFHELLQAGLDHLFVTLDPAEESGWSCIRDALPEDIFLAVHITLNHNNAPGLDAALERLVKMGVKTVSLSAGEPGMDETLAAGRKKAAELQMTLVWDVAVPYSSQNPLTLEIPENTPEGAGQAWLYVEPDGDILPSQGSHTVLGNFLEEPWEKIAAERAKLV